MFIIGLLEDEQEQAERLAAFFAALPGRAPGVLL